MRLFSFSFSSPAIECQDSVHAWVLGATWQLTTRQIISTEVGFSDSALEDTVSYFLTQHTSTAKQCFFLRVLLKGASQGKLDSLCSEVLIN